MSLRWPLSEMQRLRDYYAPDIAMNAASEDIDIAEAPSSR